MKYDVILFDADETLYDFKKAEVEAFRNTMLDFEVNYDEEIHFNTYKKINTAIWKELEEGKITQAELKIERFRRFLKHMNMDFDATYFANIFMGHLANGSYLYDGSEELITFLKNDLKIAIVTNGLSVVQDKRIRKSKIAHLFDEIIISEEVSISKPDPRIFEHTLNVLNYFDKDRVLMVGDNLTSDILGGINFGIDTCWYNPNKLDNHTDITPTYDISDYEQLKKIVFE